MPKSARLDVLVVERGLLSSRQAAQAAIMDGGVLVNGQKITKPGTAVNLDARIEITNKWQEQKYVSRGGLKLERALDAFGIDPANRTCLDLGASTGGFTDCLLQKGARLVYAIDVGYGQLDWKLRQDEKVIVKERTNARHLSAQDLYGTNEQPADLAVADLSFISAMKVLPAAIKLLQPVCDLVVLIKPQFEAGRSAVGKGGVVREQSAHVTVLENFIAGANELHLAVVAITYSPIKGPAGNIEFLAHLMPQSQCPAITQLDVQSIVQEAHTLT